MKCLTYLRLSTKEQNNGIALERQLFAVYQAVKKIGGILEEDNILQDQMSGKRDDRPDLGRLEEMVRARAIDVVIFYRVDRLGRDMELLSRLAKLFESTGVRVYICAKGGFINWKDPEDWDYWARASVDSAKESRKLSARGLAAWEFTRFKKEANHAVPWGYKRINRQYCFGEDSDKARQLIDLYLECEGNINQVVSFSKESFGKYFTNKGFRYWLKNPVLRGHTPRKTSIDFNTHTDILISPQDDLLISRFLQQRAIYRGRNADKTPYTLTGLCRCVCDCPCSMANIKRSKTNYLYIRCNTNSQGSVPQPFHKPSTIRYDFVEAEVCRQLSEASDRIASALANGITEGDPNPAILELEQKISKVRSLINSVGDEEGLLSQKIALLQNQIAQLSHIRIDSVTRDQLQSRFVAIFNQAENFWEDSPADLRRDVFIEFIDFVLIDFAKGSVRVNLKPILL